ncbi:hypothetical protein BC830DRAFT_164343 [Chytriomyces sp. MP71]|nr:hypothetical protein BC830DRAFT_164343 [Chytriomyces sp. MP71]
MSASHPLQPKSMGIYTFFTLEAATLNKASKRGSSRKHAIYIYSRPTESLILCHERSLNKVIVIAGNPAASEQSILADSCNVIMSYFSQDKVSSNRLLYIAISRVFDPQAPLPFGGKKSKPGYAEYSGRNAYSLLEYTISMCFKWYWGCRGPGALQFVVDSVNHALEWHRERDRDFLNELMLKGMKRAGHIEWSKASYVPPALRQEGERDNDVRAVFFTPRRCWVPQTKIQMIVQSAE